MTYFGIGTNTQNTNVGNISGKQIEIACECWFTSTGNTKPLKFKFRDDNGVIQTVDNIHIHYSENKNYSGIHSLEYDCTILFNENNYHVKLIFFKDECRWIMKNPVLITHPYCSQSDSS